MKKEYVTRIIAFSPAFSSSFAYFSYLFVISIRSISPLDLIRPIILHILLLSAIVWLADRYYKDPYILGIGLLLFCESVFFSFEFFLFSGAVLSGSVLIWILISRLFRMKASLKHISILLTLIGIGMVFSVNWIFGVQPFVQIPWGMYLKSISERHKEADSMLIVPSNPPDIYFIILDGYARSDILQGLYDFDNSNFTNFLFDKGFTIPENNHSNYSRTTLSIPSILNMQYVHTIYPNVEQWPYWWLMSPLIQNSQVITALEEAGYLIATASGGWEITDLAHADLIIRSVPVQINDFEKILLQRSLIGRLGLHTERLVGGYSFASQRKAILNQFESISDMTQIDETKFVFLHILSPHPPFIFGKNGEEIIPSYGFFGGDASDFPGSADDYKSGYIQQLQYVNQKTEEAIQSILTQSDEPPIIVIISDHGPGLFTDFNSPDNSCIKERLSNFAAFYFPNVDNDLVPSDITSVNIFRFIFDQYFGTSYGLLENAYYFPQDDVYLYRYTDVAARLEESCEISPEIFQDIE